MDLPCHVLLGWMRELSKGESGHSKQKKQEEEAPNGPELNRLIPDMSRYCC